MQNKNLDNIFWYKWKGKTNGELLEVSQSESTVFKDKTRNLSK